MRKARNGLNNGIANSSVPQDQTLQPTGVFPQTRWSLIVDARGKDKEALASLCQQYWKPLYIYARQKGSSPAEAEDLTQGFFVTLLSKGLFEKAERERGRLRTLLLFSFQNFIVNEWRKQSAQKRGGGVCPVSIDAGAGEEWLQTEAAGGATPEVEFERSWAREILDQTRAKLAADYAEAGKTAEFEMLADQLEQGKKARPYPELAQHLGIDVATARYMSFKLRQRFRDALEKVVADTVTNSDEAAGEMQHLLTVFESP